ncbi:hypothetical protein RRF57_013008 [Xylaria bambusicola]|uniref:Uncharacterized protein n=1 Tax=Xylaria bambusicola TaxID=326684 RepID=A0AAN7ZE07_9PEZI
MHPSSETEEKGRAGQSSVPATPKKTKGTPAGGKTPKSSGTKRKNNSALDEDEDEERILKKKQIKLEDGASSFGQYIKDIPDTRDESEV